MSIAFDRGGRKPGDHLRRTAAHGLFPTPPPGHWDKFDDNYDKIDDPMAMRTAAPSPSGRYENQNCEEDFHGYLQTAAMNPYRAPIVFNAGNGYDKHDRTSPYHMKSYES